MVDHIPPLLDFTDEAIAAVEGALAKPYSGGAHAHFETALAELRLAEDWLNPPPVLGELFPPLPAAQPEFTIILKNLLDDTNHLGLGFHNVVFPRDITHREGWAFGDRMGYKCAVLYVMRAGEIAARLCIQAPKQVGTTSAYIQVNDKNGAEYQPQKPVPLPEPTYTDVPKPADLVDHRVDFSKPSGVTATILLPAVAQNPNGWFLPTLNTPNKIVVSGYLGTTTGVVMTFERVGAELDMTLVGQDQPGW